MATNNTVLKSVKPKAKPRGGSRKGVPNKATANARTAIGLFVDNNSERLQGWLDEIAAEEGPKAAFMCFKDLIEYHVPKLGRQEITGADGKDLVAPQFIVAPIATLKPE